MMSVSSAIYSENKSKSDMIEMYETFITLACTLLFSFGGIKLYDYLYTYKKKSTSDSSTLIEKTPSLRVTRYHSENVIKYHNSDEFTMYEKKACFDFINTMAFMFILKKHTFICKTSKFYDHKKKTGVFIFDDLFVIKYSTFSDMKESQIYNLLPSRGINAQYKVITPIWYSFFEDKEYVDTKGGSSELQLHPVPLLNTEVVSSNSDSDGQDPNTINEPKKLKTYLELYDTFDKKQIKVRRRDIRSIEVQPFLKNSMVLHKWYKSAFFNLKNHDFVIGSMMLTLARSIKFCHDVGLVHGDIKPDNILVTYDEDDLGTETDPASQSENVEQTMSSGTRNRLFNITGKTRNHCDIPTVYLIDFGMCGHHEKDEGTGGTRPFCAPETTNIKVPPPLNQNDKKARYSEPYTWCTLNKQHDIWSWGFILYTIIAYRDIYNVYEEYPSDAFDDSGYINETQQEYEFEIKTHPFYPVIRKTLSPPETRPVCIDDVITELDQILKAI